eukprot:2310609-Prymnesium_polylepis.1
MSTAAEVADRSTSASLALAREAVCNHGVAPPQGRAAARRVHILISPRALPLPPRCIWHHRRAAIASAACHGPSTPKSLASRCRSDLSVRLGARLAARVAPASTRPLVAAAGCRSCG